MNLFGLFSWIIVSSVVYPSVQLLVPNHEVTDYVFVVDVTQQKNRLYYKDTLIDSFNVSTGSKTRYEGNRDMPAGIWRLGKRMHDSLAPIYGARLIYLERFSDVSQAFIPSNRAFHGTNEPENIGSPTSMGCVYHHDRDIINLYSFIPNHTLVISVK